MLGLTPSLRTLHSPTLALLLALPLACGEGSGDDGGSDTLISTTGVSTSPSGSTGSSDETAGVTTDTQSTSDDASTSASTDSQSTTDTTSTDGTTTDTTDSDTTDTGADPVPLCQIPCASLADCVQPGASAPYDDDNYECTNEGYCLYTGCNSDSECAALGNYVCADMGSGNYCATACTAPADCDLGGGPAYDGDNYDCDAGACIYAGCNSDAECDASVAGTICVDLGAGVMTCATACSTATDCDQGQLAYDADNYECVSGHCEYLGCNSDAECMEFTNLICV